MTQGRLGRWLASIMPPSEYRGSGRAGNRLDGEETRHLQYGQSLAPIDY
jgi:hypothetical protein